MKIYRMNYLRHEIFAIYGISYWVGYIDYIPVLFYTFMGKGLPFSISLYNNTFDILVQSQLGESEWSSVQAPLHSHHSIG